MAKRMAQEQLTGDTMVFVDEIKAIQKKYDKKTEKILFNKIEKAFSGRARPKDMHQLSLNYTKIIMHDDMVALKQFLGKDWRDITFEIYKEYLDALYVFTPSAYAYYLPGLLITTANVKTDEFLINSVIFSLMDYEKIITDSYLYERWAKLTIDEYIVIKEWLRWISRNEIYNNQEVMDAIINIDKLINRAQKLEIKS